MINLLPHPQKNEIRAGRTNILLLRYITLLLANMALIAVLLATVYISLSVSASTAKQHISENQQRTQSYTETKAAADAFRSDLTVAKLILEKDIHYSKLIYKISNALPPGVVLDSLTVDSQTLGTSVTINASASSYASAVGLKKSFETKTNLFSDVHFDTIKYDKDVTTPYKYKTGLNVIINKAAL